MIQAGRSGVKDKNLRDLDGIKTGKRSQNTPRSFMHIKERLRLQSASNANSSSAGGAMEF
jgi:hypothetical protein